MSNKGPPVIERPQRSSPVRIVDKNGSPHMSANFSPLASFQAVFSKATQADNENNPNALTPRPPIVHFFVCDHGNAKVKAFADQFIELLVENGIRVYPELYLTHQPGYQVRAVSFNTNADYFFQIHSKTAGPGRVRLYIDGQPKRMSIQEAVVHIWSTWRLKCGALSKAEVDSLSTERLITLLGVFADIKPENVNIEPLQAELRQSILNNQSVSPVLTKLTEFTEILETGRQKVNSMRVINSEWKSEPGTVLSRCLPTQVISGLSVPLREVLLSIIDQTLRKVSTLQSIAQKYGTTEETRMKLEDDSPELEIIDDTPQTQTNWNLMLESTEDHHQSMPSLGDHVIGSSGFLAMAPTSILDDF
ncbi:hypothetical protein TVAG_204340 [Trichomonas vaginalis G3]|uniref:Uncharacterized protein n=1 Tax=Trichomonas vaginalis (strain ATCC PRA-98 / G3) TaxID=412133 RepID=A2FJ28_TRIV3|nr:hypothetical protein TVAGG3_0879270 [Trichomonas vaginalis G3]EAX95092.1 hypothetical protein TVAG_204340 [Trichomonas vaginalis G3]KAI5501927.1 hypothetical protein TVAGG3_0879270 [Trichomonas vaginalis G3]|eukprot:XP_001308022.1 hypothetical protein [Trichomonas vaginalis G3]